MIAKEDIAEIAFAIAEAIRHIQDGRKIRYHYATVKAETVFALAMVPRPKDSYISKDSDSEALKELLAKGYRWVRTDGEIAVFEKEIRF